VEYKYKVIKTARAGEKERYDISYEVYNLSGKYVCSGQFILDTTNCSTADDAKKKLIRSIQIDALDALREQEILNTLSTSGTITL